MAKFNTNRATSTEEKKATAWINFKVNTSKGMKNVGGIPLYADNALHAQLIAQLQDNPDVCSAFLAKSECYITVPADADNEAVLELF